MPVIIEEIHSEIVPGPGAGTPDAGMPRPAEGTEQGELLDLLELAREREERLRVD